MIALTEAVKRSALMGLLCALSCSGADATVQDGDKANVHPAGSVEKRRYADALVDALQVYQREVRVHHEDDSAARWMPWLGHGYRLSAKEGGTMALVASLTRKSTEADFAVGIALPQGKCPGETMVALVGTVFRTWKARFKSECHDGYVFYRAVRVDDTETVRRLFRQGGQVTVTVGRSNATFDLSSVPVVEAKLAVDALGPVPD